MPSWPEGLKSPDGYQIDPYETTAVDAAIETRFSTRAFLQVPIPRPMLLEILRVAGRAPSGTNIQPWKVYILQGEARDSLVRKVCAAHDAIYADPDVAAEYTEEYDYYPEKWVTPYLERRREMDMSLYSLLNITRGDRQKMHQQVQQNFRFFEAPVGLIFTIDRSMGRGSLLDYGMFLQNIMVAARGRGLHTCAQAAWNPFGKIVLPHVGAPANEMLLCAMCIGYAEPSAKVNELYTTRLPVEQIATWVEEKESKRSNFE